MGGWVTREYKWTGLNGGAVEIDEKFKFKLYTTAIAWRTISIIINTDDVTQSRRNIVCMNLNSLYETRLLYLDKKK